MRSGGWGQKTVCGKPVGRPARWRREGIARRRRKRAASILMAGLLAAFAVLFAPPAQAQTTTTLVSNTGQSTSASEFIGIGDHDKISTQGFRTGPSAGGFRLDSVGVFVHNEDLESGEEMIAHIYTANASGGADTLVHTLTSPASYTDAAVNTFTAPMGAMLDANTDYLVVFEGKGSAGNDFQLRLTDADAQDSGAAMRWSIENARRRNDNLVSAADAFMIAVNGEALCASTDDVWCATLRPVTIASVLGCGNDVSGSHCTNSNRLSEDEFDYDGTDFAVHTIWDRPTGRLEFEINPGPSAAATAVLVLDIDGESFALKDASKSGGNFQWANADLSWSTGTDVALSLREGTGTPASTDPTLTALALEDTGGNTVALSPAFATNTDTYRANVAGTVSRITIEATPANSAATVAYLDADDAELTDAASATGFQVDLSQGENVIKAEVTAGDTVTTEVYTVTVVRGNIAATGAPDITGRARVGDTLGASPGDIADSNGLTKAEADTAGYAYTYQWIRVATDSTETDIAGETGAEYTVVAADLGLTLKVRASFKDDADNAEMRTSAATATVQPATGCLADTVRLRGGNVESEGEVEYCRDNEWRNVCDDMWDKKDANVACRMAGYPDGAKSATTRSTFISAHNVKFWLDDVDCDGSETSLADCGHVGWGVSDCRFSERAGVRCKVPASTDATLSGLTLTDTDSNTVALNETFASATTTYTASVTNAVSRVTVAATTSDANATVAWLAGNDAALTDADTEATGFQVDLGPGANVIKAKVTAQDTMATQTYQVTVTRATAAGCTDTDAIWCATLTVGEQVTSGVTAGYGFVDLATDVGALSDTDFTYGGTPYAIKALGIGPDTNPELFFRLDPHGRRVFADARFTLHIGTGTFSFGDATFDNGSMRRNFQWDSTGLSWSVGDTITVKLTESAAADTRLSELTVADTDGNAIELTPAFAPDTLAYAAELANTVATVTVTAAPTGTNATLEWLDGDDAALTDADTAEGFQVDLVVGDNVVKAKVTAEDTVNIKTYELTLTRLASGPATGAPEITGPAQVGRSLKALEGTIADGDGIEDATFAWQWIRVDASDNPTDITGATSDTYTPVQADEGQTLKVRASFSDDVGNPETLTSAATSPVVPDAAPCPAGAVWCTVLTSGGGDDESASSGFSTGRGGLGAIGSLVDDTFTFDGTAYTVTDVVAVGGHAIYLGTEPDLPDDGGGLTLHVQRLTGTLDLVLADGSLSFQGGLVGGNAWEFSGATEIGEGNPSLLRTVSRVNGRYFLKTDPGTRIMVRLSLPVGASFGSAEYTATEGGADATVTVTLTPPPTSSVTIPITATGQGGATSADWTGIPPTLHFLAGQSSNTFTVSAVNDTDEDEGESVLLAFGALPSGVPEGLRPTAVVQLVDDDSAVPGEFQLIGMDGMPATDGRGLVQGFYRTQVGTDEEQSGWGTVCDDRIDRGFTDYDSGDWVDKNYAPTLLCKLMDKGYNKGELIDSGPYRLADDNDPRPIWVDDLRCKEGATKLDDCYHAGIGLNNCTHREDVALFCSTVVLQTVIEPLRVAFVDVPKTGHDGETAFTFGLDFSEAVAITAEDMRDHALEVSGATVTSAALADGRDDLWEFTLEPSGTDNVVITVSGKDSCSDTGALCTSLGAGLENRLSTVLPYVPPAEAGLTAEFLDVPEKHSGDSDSTIRLELLFSEDVKVSNNRMRRQILKLQNATLEEARRIDRRKDYWEFRLRPTSHRAIVLSLASAEECGARDVICTFDGNPLSEPATATIVGPPGLSVADAEVEEGPDAKLAFPITLDRAVSWTVTVQASTSDGTAVAGEDYRAKTLTKTFAPGETRKVAVIRVLDDSHNEGTETMTLTLSNPVGAYIADGEAVGTITNSDHMPQAWLARFGRTVADQVIDAVEGRMTAARSPGTAVAVAGQRIGSGADAAALEEDEARAGLQALSDWFRGVEEEENGPESRALTNRDLLAGTSFSLTGGTGETGFGSVWGRGAVSRFDGREGDLTLDGEVESALLGTDYARGRGMLGLVLSHSRGEGGYRAPSGGGAVESTLTGVYPWGRYEVSERLSAWGVVGYGAGTLTLRPAGQTAIETDMDLSMAAVGARGVLAEAPAGGGL